MRTYEENKLSPAIRSIVKTVYYDYSITLIEDVTKPHREPVYIIHLESEKEWINVKVQNRESTEWHDLIKPWDLQ